MAGFYPSVEVQSVYSTAPADWAKIRDEFFGVSLHSNGLGKGINLFFYPPPPLPPPAMGKFQGRLGSLVLSW